MTNPVARIWQRLNEPRESRGGFSAWGCPGDGCSGIFRTPEQASEHAGIARVIGSHEVAPQRRARRERDRAARQLHQQARRAGRSR